MLVALCKRVCEGESGIAGARSDAMLTEPGKSPRLKARLQCPLRFPPHSQIQLSKHHAGSERLHSTPELVNHRGCVAGLHRRLAPCLAGCRRHR